MGYNSMALSQLPQHPLLRQHPTPAAYDVSKKIPTEGRSTGRWQRCGLHIQEAARAQDAPSKQFRLLLCTIWDLQLESPIQGICGENNDTTTTTTKNNNSNNNKLTWTVSALSFYSIIFYKHLIYKNISCIECWRYRFLAKFTEASDIMWAIQHYFPAVS